MMCDLSLLSNDNPLIRSCSDRAGVDIVQGGDGTYSIRSANMCTMPAYYNVKTPKTVRDRPVNFFTTRQMDVLRISVAPAYIMSAFSLKERDEALDVVAHAVQTTEETGDRVPILVSGEHVYWGTVAGVSKCKCKVDFRILNASPPDVDAAMEEVEAVVDRCDAKRPKTGVVTYNGVRFDDEDEARHARFYDLLQIRYETQPRTVSHPLLDNATGTYRTDFFIPSLNAYIETTGTEPSARKVFACEVLAREAYKERRDVYLVWGGMHPPQRDAYEQGQRVMKVRKFLVEEHEYRNGVVQLDVCPDDGYAWVATRDGYAIRKLGSTMNRDWDDKNLQSALKMAREHVF